MAPQVHGSWASHPNTLRAGVQETAVDTVTTTFWLKLCNSLGVGVTRGQGSNEDSVQGLLRDVGEPEPAWAPEPVLG